MRPKLSPELLEDIRRTERLNRDEIVRRELRRSEGAAAGALPEPGLEPDGGIDGTTGLPLKPLAVPEPPETAVHLAEAEIEFLLMLVGLRIAELEEGERHRPRSADMDRVQEFRKRVAEKLARASGRWAAAAAAAGNGEAETLAHEGGK